MQEFLSNYNTKINKKNKIMKKAKLSLLAMLVLSFFFTSCFEAVIVGQGDVVEQTLEISDFQEIINQTSVDVHINYGDSLKVVAVGQSNIINRLRKTVSGGKWYIELLPGNYRNFDLTIYITTPNFDYIRINGSGNIIIDNNFNLSNVQVNINGSGDIVMNDTLTSDNIDLNINGSGYIQLIANSQNISSNINGSGNIVLSGISESQSIIINGSGKYEAFEMQSANADIEVRGSGDSQIDVSDYLKVKILGSGDIYYSGHPEMDIDIAGSGSIHSWNK